MSIQVRECLKSSWFNVLVLPFFLVAAFVKGFAFQGNFHWEVAFLMGVLTYFTACSDFSYLSLHLRIKAKFFEDISKEGISKLVMVWCDTLLTASVYYTAMTFVFKHAETGTTLDRLLAGNVYAGLVAMLILFPIMIGHVGLRWALEKPEVQLRKDFKSYWFSALMLPFILTAALLLRFGFSGHFHWDLALHLGASAFVAAGMAFDRLSLDRYPENIDDLGKVGMVWCNTLFIVVLHSTLMTFVFRFADAGVIPDEFFAAHILPTLVNFIALVAFIISMEGFNWALDKPC